MLTTNSYLRLDPNVLFASIREGGRYLAKMGRKEVQPCIAGLRQYGMSFEEAFDEVDHLLKLVAERGTVGGATGMGMGSEGRQVTPPLPMAMSAGQTQGGHHGHGGSIQAMSASPNGYSISSMSNPPPSVGPLRFPTRKTFADQLLLRR